MTVKALSASFAAFHELINPRIVGLNGYKMLVFVLFAPLARGDETDLFQWPLLCEDEGHVFHGMQIGSLVAFIVVGGTFDDFVRRDVRRVCAPTDYALTNTFALVDHCAGAGIAEPLARGGAVVNFISTIHASISSSGPTKP